MSKITFQPSTSSPEGSPTLDAFSHTESGDATPTVASPTSPSSAGPAGTKSKDVGGKDCADAEHAERPTPIKHMSLDTAYKGPVIPPSSKARKKHRTLVLCFDGTGDQFDNDNSNVVNFFSLLSKGESKQQLCYYQAGIGTYTIPQIATPLMSKFRKTLDMMLGSSLHHHVMGGYEFLMENFKRTDRICIFGFSRGAYTARALAGMIEKVGLLPAGNHQQVPFAYKMYMKDDEMGWKQSVLFKRAFSMDVDIEFVGVWDTVDSVGILPKHVPFTKNNTCVKTFRHAISLDEHRVKFKANLFDKVVTQETRNADFTYVPISQHITNCKKRAKKLFGLQKEVEHLKEGLVRVNSEDKFNKGSKLQEKYTNKDKNTDALEVWFAGCHTDVGGGSVINATRFALARIPLRWMVRQCFLAESGIQFAAGRLHEIGLDPTSLYPVVQDRPAPLDIGALHLEDLPNEKKRLWKIKKEAKENVEAECEGNISAPVCDSPTNTTPTSTLSKKPNQARGPMRGMKRKFLRGRTMHDADHVCVHCVEDEMHHHMVAHSEGAHCEYESEGRHDELPVNEEHEELHDALSPVFDQLSLAPSWWLLEWIPFVHRHVAEDGTFIKVVSINHGRSRRVTQQQLNGIKVHRSVKMRMDADERALGKKYTPRVKFEVEPTWVD